MRELLMRAVSGWEFTTAAVASAEDAMRAIRKEPADIFIVDINLPGMSGIELLEKLREEEVAAQAIILTGFGDLDAARAAIHLDVVEFLTKPCHLGDLERALDRARRRVVEAESVRLPDVTMEQGPGAGPSTLEEVERQHILAALRRNAGNRTAAATELGISLRTLYYRLTEYQKQGFAIE